MTERAVFVDSWAWVALFNKRDPYHRDVLPAYAGLIAERRPLFMSNAVLYESLHLTQRHYGNAVLLEAGQRIFSTIASSRVTVLRTDADIEDEAWQLQLRFPDQRISYVDCLSYVLMRRHGIPTAFTGDTHFTLLGFNIIPDIPR